MARADGPALARVAWHFGALLVTGTLLWRLRATAWAVPLLVVHGYVLAFTFCPFHEAAHRTAFRTRWLNTVVGTLAGLLTAWPYRNYRVYPGSTIATPRIRSGTPSCTSPSRPRGRPTSWC